MVLITAINDGATAIARLVVTTSGDSDGDGLPDDWEIANGLDPNNPIDALDDQDLDGLSTIDEYTLGTDPFTPDSDGDGLLDGEEVNDVGTDPLLFDTDGDGLSDGLEIQTGSDPLDPNSYNLAEALASLSATPQSFTIVFNTVFGEATRQLQVIGDLIDGTTIDLTARSRGTTYTSSDLTIANFGVEDGLVFGGQDGVATVTVGTSGFSATVVATVQSFSPTALGFVEIPGAANGVAVAGDFAYVASGTTGLQVVDVSVPENPTIVSNVDFGGVAMEVVVVGDLAFVASNGLGLVIVDILDPYAPQIVEVVTLSLGSSLDGAADVKVAAGVAYVMTPVVVEEHFGKRAIAGRLYAIDIGSPTLPQILGFVEVADGRAVDVAGDVVYVAAGSDGLVTVDVSDPSDPVVLGGTLTKPEGSSAATDVAVRGDIAYVADGGDSTMGGLKAVDVSDPANPVLVGSSSDQFVLTGVVLDDGLALTSDYFYWNAVPIFGLSTPGPVLQELVTFSAGSQGEDLDIRDGLVYVVGNPTIVGVSGLFIGRYKRLVDDAGFPPSVSITAPAADGTVTERTFEVLAVDAVDDVQVRQVDFLIDGEVAATDFSRPFEVSVAIPAGRTTVAVGALATDTGGNQALAEEVVVPVVPNPAPVVELVRPRPGDALSGPRRLFMTARATDDVAVVRVDLIVNGTPTSSTQPPYEHFIFTTPGVDYEVTAIAYDAVGPSAPAGPVVVSVSADEPPFVEVIEPAPGQEIVRGAQIAISIGAIDDVAVAQVGIFIDGQLALLDTVAPFGGLIALDPVGATATIQARAEDDVGQATISGAVTVSVVDDPLMSIRGRTTDIGGNVLVGVEVTASAGFSGTQVLSDTNGELLFTGLPTTAGSYALSGFLLDDQGELRGTLDSLVAPQPGGEVQVGDLVLLLNVDGGVELPTAVVGSVVDGVGDPVVGATVSVFNGIGVVEVATDASGGFTTPLIRSRASDSGGLLEITAVARVLDGVNSLRGRTSQPTQAVQDGVTDVGAITVASFDPAADPLTTVTGLVDAGEELGGDVIVITDYRFVTGTWTAGSFSVVGVPALEGDVDVVAVVEIDMSFAVGSADPPVPAVPGGTTDVGTILIEVNLGQFSAPLGPR